MKRIIADSNKLLADQNIDGEEKEVSLLANKDILCDIRSTIQEIHGKILEKLEEEKDIEEEITIASDGVKEIGKAVFAVNKRIEEKYDSTKSLASPSTMYAPVQTRLPKLVLSSFDGDPLLFHLFWDSFKATVHKNRRAMPKLAFWASQQLRKTTSMR